MTINFTSADLRKWAASGTTIDPTCLHEVAAEWDRLRGALERLGCTHTMTAPLALDPLRDAELIARIKFAKDAIST